jgi:hypothetical protein
LVLTDSGWVHPPTRPLKVLKALAMHRKYCQKGWYRAPSKLPIIRVIRWVGRQLHTVLVSFESKISMSAYARSNSACTIPSAVARHSSGHPAWAK